MIDTVQSWSIDDDEGGHDPQDDIDHYFEIIGMTG